MADAQTDNKGLIYDLRQHYANIVGEHLRDAAEARKADNYPAWFENLQDIYTITRHEIIKVNKNCDTEYNSKLNSIATLSQENKDTWSMRSRDSKASAEIKHALRDLEMWIYSEMKEADMFGKKFSDDEDDL